MEKKDVCDFSDLLFHAETMGVHWNQAHEILVDAGWYEGDVYIEDIVCDISEDREFSEAENIIISFAMKHGVDTFYIKPK